MIRSFYLLSFLGLSVFEKGKKEWWRSLGYLQVLLLQRIRSYIHKIYGHKLEFIYNVSKSDNYCGVCSHTYKS